MTELRAIRDQMANHSGSAEERRRRRHDRRDQGLERRADRRRSRAAAELSRADRTGREAEGRTRPDPRRHQPHQARNRRAARQELFRRRDGQGQWRARRGGRRHRGSDPADSRSGGGDRPGRQRAHQGEFAGAAEHADRGNPGAGDLDLRGLQLPGPHRPAHQQGDDDDEVHRASHQHHDGHLGRRRRHQGPRAADRRHPRGRRQAAQRPEARRRRATPRRTTSTRCSTDRD